MNEFSWQRDQLQGGYDRAAIMRDAHARYRRRRGTSEPISFSEALRRAWAAARIRRAVAVQETKLAA